MACNLKFNGINGEFSLDKFKGKKIVLYFYPKDNTSGCTLEAIQFSELKDEFEKLNAVVIGVRNLLTNIILLLYWFLMNIFLFLSILMFGN